MLATSAATNPPQRGSSSAANTAAAVPTSTGATAAGRVRGRAAFSQILTDASGERLLLRSKSTGEEFGFRLSVMETGDTRTEQGGAISTDLGGIANVSRALRRATNL